MIKPYFIARKDTGIKSVSDLKGRTAAKIWIGTSGFNYKHWGGGAFYPEGLPEREWLEFYSARFKTVELNVTFYRLPRKEVFRNWHRRVPHDFGFVVKGSRYITHVKRLKDVDEALKRLFQSASGLRKKMLAVLWQMPPSLHIDMDRLKNFLKKIKGYKTRHAFEFRHQSWWSDEVFDLLNEHGATFVDADLIDALPSPLGSEFAFYFMRRHGTRGRYSGSYTEKMLFRMAASIKRIAGEGKEVFVYFNNDAMGHAVENAMTLTGLLIPRSLRERSR